MIAACQVHVFPRLPRLVALRRRQQVRPSCLHIGTPEQGVHRQARCRRQAAGPSEPFQNPPPPPPKKTHLLPPSSSGPKSNRMNPFFFFVERVQGGADFASSESIDKLPNGTGKSGAFPRFLLHVATTLVASRFSGPRRARLRPPAYGGTGAAPVSWSRSARSGAVGPPLLAFLSTFLQIPIFVLPRGVRSYRATIQGEFSKGHLEGLQVEDSRIVEFRHSRPLT